MTSKILFGLLVSGIVGLGAATASADEIIAPQYHEKKAAVIDRYDYFCKVPIRIKHEKIVLSSEHPRIVAKKFKKNYKEYLLLKCHFKDKVGYGYYRNITRSGFLCKAPGGYDLKTYNSLVNVHFERHGYYSKYSKYNRHVKAKVWLQCLFEIKPRNKHVDKYPHDRKNDDKHGYDD